MTVARFGGSFLLAVLVASSAGAAGGLRPVGSEFVVVGGSYDLIDGYELDVAGDEFGNFVIVWTGRDYRVHGVWVSSADVAGGPFELGGDPDDTHFVPRVAMRPSGEFVVAWTSYPTVVHGPLVYPLGRRFDRTAMPLGDAFPLDDPPGSGVLAFTDVAVHDDGTFVVVWADYDADHEGIVARRFDASGAPMDGGLRVNSDEAGNQVDPAVAADGSGGFVVAWTDFSTEAGDGGERVEARRFDAGGTPVGPEMLVNQTTAGSQVGAVVEADAAGNFVVVWRSHYDQDVYGSAVAARRFDATAMPTGDEVRVAKRFWYTGREAPRAAMDAGGEFVVVWGSRYTQHDIFGRVSPAATTFGKRFTVNTGEASGGTYPSIAPAVATGGSGDFLVVWFDADQGLLARRYGPPRTMTRLKLTDDPDPGKRKLTVTATAMGPAGGSPLGRRIGPPNDGAFLHVYNAAGGDDSICIPLPAARWTAKGSTAAGAARFAYRDSEFADGPCASVTVANRKVVKAACRGAVKPLGYDLDEARQETVVVRLVTGDRSYCSVFGEARVDEPDRFAATNAAIAGGCPEPPAACP